MPLELGIWRIDGSLQRMDFGGLDQESRLQTLLAEDLSIANPEWMLIGREITTPHGGRVDLLAIDAEGNLVVIEIKRARTPREIVAQILDYGSWVQHQRADDIARIFNEYRSRYHGAEDDLLLDEAFRQHFNVSEMPEELNESHSLVVVASSFDPSTERIVNYLADRYGVSINAVFFRVFRDGEREYLSRAWLREPDEVEDREVGVRSPQTEWNGEYYGSFGIDEIRTWEDARRYGFFSGGGGSWYSNTLHMLSPGDRIWVNIPRVGYVGVAEVLESAVPVDEFMTEDGKGRRVPITSLPVAAAQMRRLGDDPDKAEYMVRVRWLKDVPAAQAVKERGFFGNQNTVARPRTPKWDYTVDRLKKRWQIQ